MHLSNFTRTIIFRWHNPHPVCHFKTVAVFFSLFFFAIPSNLYICSIICLGCWFVARSRYANYEFCARVFSCLCSSSSPSKLCRRLGEQKWEANFWKTENVTERIWENRISVEMIETKHRHKYGACGELNVPNAHHSQYFANISCSPDRC